MRRILRDERRVRRKTNFYRRILGDGSSFERRKIVLSGSNHVGGGKRQAHGGVLAPIHGAALGERHDAIVPDLCEQREIHGIGGMKNHVRPALEVGEADLHRHAFIHIFQCLFEGLPVAAQVHLQSQGAPLAVLVESEDAHGYVACVGHSALLQFPAICISGQLSAHPSIRSGGEDDTPLIGRCRRLRASRSPCRPPLARGQALRRSSPRFRRGPRGCGWRDLAPPMDPIGSESPNRESAPVRSRSAHAERGTVSPLTRPPKADNSCAIKPDNSICCQHNTP